MDAAGNLYGTTAGCGAFGLGTAWQLSANGVETVLYNFAGGISDGSYPASGVILDSNGNLYGTTVYGGGTGCSSNGCGTVYELSNHGAFALLHSFNGTDGEFPQATVAFDAGDDLYGTTRSGGE
jgi:uncharacterized repeat protein (TIGR03803 family)